jgi:hypothetical protein
LNGKRKIIVIIGVIIIIFSVAESTQAMGTNHLPPQVVVNINNQDVSRLLKPSIDLGIEPKIKIIMPSSVRIRTKSDLRNSQWLKEFLSTVRGGDNEKLIRSIISDKLLRILAELEKPIPQPSIVVEGWVNPLPRHRKRSMVEKNKCSTPSADSLLDSTKCYGHREAYDMPREVTERFEASAVSKLAKNSLKDPLLKKEYARVKKSMKEGIHPINVGYNSAFVSSDKVLIKCSKGRYLVEVGDTKVDIIGGVARGSDKSVKSFEKLMNKMYNLDLQY